MESFKSRVYTLLRRSEGFFKTDMIYLARGTFWLNGSQILTAVVSFLLAIAFANLLSQETYGTYKYILSIATLFGSITLSGLGSAVSRAVARGYEGEFGKAVRFNLKWETLISVAGLIGAAYYYVHGNQTLALGLLIISIFSPLKDSAELYSSYLTGKKDFRMNSILGVTRMLVASSWLYATILITQDPVLMVLSYFFIYTVLNTVFLWWTTKTRKPNNETDEETITLAKHTSFINNFAGFADQIDNVILFHYFGPVSLAVYNFAQAIPEYLVGFTKNLGILAMPKFAQADKDSVKKTMVDKSYFIFAFGLLMSFAYIIFAPLFFSLFFPKYTDSVKYSQLYSLILLFPAVLPAAFLDSQFAIKEKYLVSIIGNSVKIVLLFLGIFYFGILGAIVARIISKAFGVSLTFFFAYQI